MSIMSKLTASYLAGFIDGEGYISLIRRPNKNGRTYYQPTLKIALVDKWILDWIQKSYGGFLYERPPQSEHSKQSYHWELRGKNLKPFLQKICPYLKLKKKQCELVLQKIKLQESLLEEIPFKKISRINSRRTEKMEINKEYRIQQLKKGETIYQELRRLNKRGI